MSQLAVDLAPFLILGFLGSLHCVGMCGGFAIAVASHADGSFARTSLRQWTYIVGKALAYGVLGMLLAVGVSGIGDLTRGARDDLLAHAQIGITWLSAAILIWMGLGYLRLRFPLPGKGRSIVAALTGRARPLLAAARSMPGLSGVFVTGVLNGLLPCGLSWGALLLASQLAPPVAGLGAFLFGIATGPSLALVGFLPRIALGRSSSFVRPVLGLTLVAYGLMLLARLQPFPHGSGAPPPACCAHEPSSAPN